MNVKFLELVKCQRTKTMQKDEIVEEMRKYGQAFMARYDNDMTKICAALKEKERTLDYPVVNFSIQPKIR